MFRLLKSEFSNFDDTDNEKDDDDDALVVVVKSVRICRTKIVVRQRIENKDDTVSSLLLF